MVSEIMGPSFVQGRLGGSPTATVLGMLFLVRKGGFKNLIRLQSVENELLSDRLLSLLFA
jgi:hypothetical protein